MSFATGLYLSVSPVYSNHQVQGPEILLKYDNVMQAQGRADAGKNSNSKSLQYLPLQF